MGTDQLRNADELKEMLLKEGEVFFDIKVTPKSSKNAILGEMADGTIKVALTVAPEKGKANDALMKLLADEFDVPLSQVSIIRGRNKQRKTIQIRGRNGG